MMRAPIERGEPNAVQLESECEDAALRAGRIAGIVQLRNQARVGKDGEIEFDSLFSIGVEPEKRRDAGKLGEGGHAAILA